MIKSLFQQACSLILGIVWICQQLEGVAWDEDTKHNNNGTFKVTPGLCNMRLPVFTKLENFLEISENIIQGPVGSYIYLIMGFVNKAIAWSWWKKLSTINTYVGIKSNLKYNRSIINQPGNPRAMKVETPKVWNDSTPTQVYILLSHGDERVVYRWESESTDVGLLSVWENWLHSWKKPPHINSKISYQEMSNPLRGGKTYCG